MLLKDGLDDTVGEVRLQKSVGERLRRGRRLQTGLAAAILGVEEKGVDVHEQMGGELCVVLTETEVESDGL